MADKNVPAKPDSNNDDQHDGSRGNGSNFLAIGELHYHGNDLTELRKLAEVNPELANKVVDLNNYADQRANTSYRFGVGASMVLVLGILGSFMFLLLKAGILPTIGMIVGILAVALLVRVILTGHWSDTTWFGKFVSLLARALGSKDD